MHPPSPSSNIFCWDTVPPSSACPSLELVARHSSLVARTRPAPPVATGRHPRLTPACPALRLVPARVDIIFAWPSDPSQTCAKICLLPLSLSLSLFSAPSHFIRPLKLLLISITCFSNNQRHLRLEYFHALPDPTNPLFFGPALPARPLRSRPLASNNADPYPPTHPTPSPDSLFLSFYLLPSSTPTGSWSPGAYLVCSLFPVHIGCSQRHRRRLRVYHRSRPVRSTAPPDLSP